MSGAGAKISTKVPFDFEDDDTGIKLQLRSLSTTETMPITMKMNQPELQGDALLDALRLGLKGWPEQEGLPPFIKGRGNVDKNIDALPTPVAINAASAIIEKTALSMEQRGNSDSP